jgi:hypothetical protein
MLVFEGGRSEERIYKGFEVSEISIIVNLPTVCLRDKCAQEIPR